MTTLNGLSGPSSSWQNMAQCGFPSSESASKSFLSSTEKAKLQDLVSRLESQFGTEGTSQATEDTLAEFGAELENFLQTLESRGSATQDAYDLGGQNWGIPEYCPPTSPPSSGPGPFPPPGNFPPPGTLPQPGPVVPPATPPKHEGPTSLFDAVGQGVGKCVSICHDLAHGVLGVFGLNDNPMAKKIDQQIVHPLLWDPIERITGYDIDGNGASKLNTGHPQWNVQDQKAAMAQQQKAALAQNPQLLAQLMAQSR